MGSKKADTDGVDIDGTNQPFPPSPTKGKKAKVSLFDEHPCDMDIDGTGRLVPPYVPYVLPGSKKGGNSKGPKVKATFPASVVEKHPRAPTDMDIDGTGHPVPPDVPYVLPGSKKGGNSKGPKVKATFPASVAEKHPRAPTDMDIDGTGHPVPPHVPYVLPGSKKGGNSKGPKVKVTFPASVPRDAVEKMLRAKLGRSASEPHKPLFSWSMPLDADHKTTSLFGGRAGHEPLTFAKPGAVHYPHDHTQGEHPRSDDNSREGDPRCLPGAAPEGVGPHACLGEVGVDVGSKGVGGAGI